MTLLGCAPGDVTDDIYVSRVLPNNSQTDIGSLDNPFRSIYVSEDTVYLGGVPLSREGIPGPEGPTGPQGIQGEPGTAGSQGQQGLPGEPGTPGLPGSQGEPGEQGLAGNDGAAGAAGADGYTPIKGVDYFDGDQGIQGLQGSQGIQGIPGVNNITTSTPTEITGLLKGDGSFIDTAIPGTDYDTIHSNRSILDYIQQAFTTSLKSSYDWLVTNITSVWKTAVDNHVASTANPHSVTKAQVGLTNVTDTAQITAGLIDAKGDIVTATADDTPARLASSAVNNQVLTVDTTTATGLKWATPAGGGESESVIVMPSDVPNTTVNLANATGMTFTADANSTYIIEGFILWDASVATVGIKLSATATNSPTIQAGFFITDAASGTPDSSSWNANDVVVTTSASAFTTYNMGNVTAIIKTAGSSSVWQLRFAAETTGTITMKAGSVIRYRKVA